MLWARPRSCPDNDLSKRRVTGALLAAVAAAVVFYQMSSAIEARWAGVPPVPSVQTASLMALGDRQLAYRSGALTLQTLGDGGGRVVPLKDYDYAKLGAWFAVLDALDPAADHVPMIAAYYFGATHVPGDIAQIVKYLGRVGDSPVGQKWRWLAHAAYLARHRMDNLDLALDFAYRLARIQPIDGKPLPIWARQMPAFLLTAQGDRQAAQALIEGMLSSADDLHPNEVNFMRGYLVEQLGVPAQEVDRVLRLRNGGQ